MTSSRSISQLRRQERSQAPSFEPGPARQANLFAAYEPASPSPLRIQGMPRLLESSSISVARCSRRAFFSPLSLHPPCPSRTAARASATAASARRNLRQPRRLSPGPPATRARAAPPCAGSKPAGPRRGSRRVHARAGGSAQPSPCRPDAAPVAAHEVLSESADEVLSESADRHAK